MTLHIVVNFDALSRVQDGDGYNIIEVTLIWLYRSCIVCFTDV